MAVGVGMSVKQPALLAAVPVAVIGSGWASWRPPDLLRFLPRALVTFVGVIGVFVGVTLLTGLGFGWISAVGVPGMIVTLAPFSLLGWALQHLLEFAGLPDAAAWAMPTAKTVAAVIMVGLMGWLFVRFSRTRPLSFMTWAYLAFAVFGSALHTWYLLWGALFLPLARTSERTLRVAAGATSVLLVYGAGNRAWRNDAVALALAAVAAAGGWLITTAGRRRSDRAGREPVSAVPVGSPYEAQLASVSRAAEEARIAAGAGEAADFAAGDDAGRAGADTTTDQGERP